MTSQSGEHEMTDLGQQGSSHPQHGPSPTPSHSDAQHGATNDNEDEDEAQTVAELEPLATQTSAHDQQRSAEAGDAAPHQPPKTPFAPVVRATTSASTRPYSAFSSSTKWLIVIIAGISAIFSPISSNIYVPAIPTLANAFHRSEQDLSLGVTVYLVFQAVTPSFFGSMSDSFGRRPVYISTLLVYLGANIGLALVPTSSYAGLLVLRMLQATGGSAVISIGAGCISDFAEPRERGKYYGIFQAGAVIGPAFGPLLGGIFAQTLGWRSIFWFLTISCGVVLIPLIFFLPESLRALVGDGSIPPPFINCSPVVMFKRKRMEKEQRDQPAGEKVQRPPKKPYAPLSAFQILLTPEILLVFLFVSLMYLEFYCILTVYSTVLKDVYNLSELKIGLCYLPSGIGSVVSSLLNGRQIDYYYRREERRVGGDYRKKGEEFRVEYTRLRCIAPFMALFLVAATALGWCLQAKAPLAATLVVNFFVGLGTGTINTATVYGQDLKPGQGGAVSASLNLVRCIFGAVGTAVIQLIYQAIGAGWTMVLLSGLCVVGVPLALIPAYKAPGWRLARQEKAQRKAAEKTDGTSKRVTHAPAEKPERAT